MIFITLKSVKSCSLNTQSLASCELLFGIFKCSLHLKRFRYKYSILFNFQGPALFASRLTAHLFYHRTGSLSSTFLKRFSKFVLVSWPLRGALEYNTTTTPFCQPFFTKKAAFCSGPSPSYFIYIGRPPSCRYGLHFSVRRRTIGTGPRFDSRGQ